MAERKMCSLMVATFNNANTNALASPQHVGRAKCPACPFSVVSVIKEGVVSPLLVLGADKCKEVCQINNSD